MPRQRTPLQKGRIEKGLTQGQLAERLGVSTATISRWETGKHAPIPLYAARIAQILNIRLEDLTTTHESGLDHKKITEKAVSPSSQLSVHDPFLPSFPLLVGREEETRWIKAHLLKHDHNSPPLPLAITGLPGIGKTTVMTALAHDEDIQALFPDGILWGYVGKPSHVQGILRHWGRLLNVNFPPLQEGEESQWTRESLSLLHQALMHKRVLLLLDDVWTMPEASQLLTIGNTSCAFVITTRFPSLATYLSREQVLTLAPLSGETSRALLAHLVPTLPLETDEMNDILTSVGGLPLALTLIGNFLQQETYSQQPRRIKAALLRLHDAKARLHLQPPRESFSPLGGMSSEEPTSLFQTIAMSLEHISIQARQALFSLSVLPAMPASFSEETALAVARCGVETVDTLADCGLLTLQGQRYQIHPIVRDYAVLCLSETGDHFDEVIQRLFTFAVAFLEGVDHDPLCVMQEMDVLQTVLDLAWKQAWYPEAFQLTELLTAYWLEQHLWEHAERYFSTALAVARQQRTYPHHAIHCLLGLGRCALARHELIRMLSFYQEAVVYAREPGAQKELLVLTLLKLGAAYLRMAHHHAQAHYAQEAKAACTEALDILRDLPPPSRLSPVVQAALPLLYEMLGTVALEDEGTLVALDYYRQGLVVAEQLQIREVSCWLLLQRGAILLYREEFAASEQALRRALALATQEHLASCTLIAMTRLLNVMLLTRRIEEARQLLTELMPTIAQEDLPQGRLLHERMTVAHSLQHAKAWVALYTGKLALVQHDLEAARCHYEEALHLARPLPENHELLRHIRHDQTLVALESQNEAEAMLSLGELQGLVPSSEDVLWQAYVSYRRAQLLLTLMRLPDHAQKEALKSKALFRKRSHLLGLHDIDAWWQQAWKDGDTADQQSS